MAPVFFAFRVMVGIGVLMLGAGDLVRRSRGDAGASAKSRGLLRAWMCMTPAGFIAVLAGWYTTEIGRQPYVIYGLMRTAEAASAVDARASRRRCCVFAIVYLFVFIAGTYYLFKLLRKGPQPVSDCAAVSGRQDRAAAVVRTRRVDRDRVSMDHGYRAAGRRGSASLASACSCTC